MVSYAQTDEVTHILSDDALAKLRTGYDPKGMNHAALVAVAGAYPGGRPLVELLIGRFYDADRWSPRERELCVVTSLATHYHGGGLFLAMHLYWGLMEGLSDDQLADTLLLTGIYGGFSVYNAGLTTLRQTLVVLAEIADSGNGDDVHWSNVLIQLRGAFR